MSSVNNKAIAYVRVDIEDQTKFNSREQKLQEKQIKEYAKKQNLEIVEWFKQVGYEPITFMHSELNKVLEFCKSNPDIKFLIVTRPEIITDSIEESYFWSFSFEREGVTVSFAKSLEPLSAQDQFAEATGLLMKAEHEREIGMARIKEITRQVEAGEA